jgi:hypothetical protein
VLENLSTFLLTRIVTICKDWGARTTHGLARIPLLYRT